MDKLDYTKPEIEIEVFETEDVITLSVMTSDEEEILFGDITWTDN